MKFFFFYMAVERGYKQSFEPINCLWTYDATIKVFFGREEKKIVFFTFF